MNILRGFEKPVAVNTIIVILDRMVEQMRVCKQTKLVNRAIIKAQTMPNGELLI